MKDGKVNKTYFCHKIFKKCLPLLMIKKKRFCVNNSAKILPCLI